MRVDPRWWQIASLAGLLTYGIGFLHFDVTLWRVAEISGTALAAQWICSRAVHIAFEWKSAMISALSLSLLMRSNSLLLMLATAVIAVSSKFLVRFNGKHVFNPTNFAIVVMMLATDRVWVSGGQWGSAAFIGFLIACAGGLVVYRSLRSDVTLAFLFFWCAILFVRAFNLGDPLTIPFYRLQNGALLIFAFFMISDPKTTPNSRAGRVLFAAIVATGAWYVQFKLFHTNALLWSLVACSPLVPLIDKFLVDARFEWKESYMKPVAASILALFLTPSAFAFCGFYVAKGDAKLFNKASQVVLVRDGDRTVMTMANDFKGDPREFAVVIPVPTVLQRGQIRVADKAAIDHLDAYSSPRLVEYFDPDPCAMYDAMKAQRAPAVAEAITVSKAERREKTLGVTIEARYTVGEYDILILSAKESEGLTTWLTESGYKLPPGAADVLGSYIRQNLKFFVAKVNLREQARTGFNYLRPLQVAYESPKFMLPIRLGTVNASGPQELFVYALTRKGRVETTNYRTVRLPSDKEIPTYVRSKFGDFYRAMFDEQVRREDMSVVFLEYAWDMNWCDPCAAEPLSRDELRKLGVFWLSSRDDNGGAVDTFISRLHVRYDRAHFPDDLVFQETGDRQNFQARYILRHPFKGTVTCNAEQYQEMLNDRYEEQSRNLAELTGWQVDDIRKKMNVAPIKAKAWWEW
jgi:Na+-translocating ferredoxin:NAD+ oxidoreductase RnfD subunit